jgi:hypothetical protein
MATETTADETEAEQEEELAWAVQTPTTRLSGTPKEVIFSGDINGSIEQTGNSFGVVWEDPELVTGEIWENTERGDTTADVVDDDTARPTDYRLADSTHERINTMDVEGETFLTTGENGPNSYQETDTIEEDRLLVWYNGLTGQRIGRVLDFNGRPFARWVDNDDGSSYLLKGLYQCADGWRDAKGSERGKMASSGKAPRVARAPILRNRVEYEEGEGDESGSATLLDEAKDISVLVDMSDAPSGNGYRAHLFDADDFADEFDAVDADIPRNDAGYVADEIDSELDMPYSGLADEVLEQAEYGMNMYTGEGWQDEPSAWEPQSTSEVESFGIAADDGDEQDDGGLSAEHEQFVTEVVGEVKGSGMTPDEMFNGGLEGLIGKYSSNFSTVPDADTIREAVYAEVSHLDVNDLE